MTAHQALIDQTPTSGTDGPPTTDITIVPDQKTFQSRETPGDQFKIPASKAKLIKGQESETRLYNREDWGGRVLRDTNLGVCDPGYQVVQEVLPGRLAEASDAVSRLLVVVASDVLLASTVVCPLPGAMQLLARSGSLLALHLVSVLHRRGPVIDLLILLDGVQDTCLEVCLQTHRGICTCR